MKEFNLEEAKAGKPVVTRDGRKARIVCFDRKNLDEKCVVALISNPAGYEESIFLYENGLRFDYCTYKFDLFMAPVKKEGWVNVYPKCDHTKVSLGSNIYESEDEAVKLAGKNAITAKIEWEE